MNANRKLWIGLGLLLVVSFSVLIWVGTEIHRVMPPIPAKVVSNDGALLFTLTEGSEDELLTVEAPSGRPTGGSSSR